MTSTATARPPDVAGRPAGRPFITSFRHKIQFLDMLVVLAAVVSGLAAGWGYGGSFAEDRTRQFLALALVLAWPIALWQAQSTAATILGQGLEEYRRVLVACSWTAVAVAAAAYGASALRGRWFLLGTITLGTVLLLVERLVMRLALHQRLKDGQSLHRVFVVAASAREGSIRTTLEDAGELFTVVGSWHLTSDLPDPAEVVRRAREVGADTLVLAPLGTEDTSWTRRLGWAMEESDLSLLVSPSLVEIAGPRLSVEPVEGLALVRVDMPRFSGPARVAKRGMDVVGASLGLALLGLPMLAIGILIRRDSPGPAIFRQVRAGERSDTFECWKFRTMRLGADTQRAGLRAVSETLGDDSAESATFKMIDDPRVTRVGRWLRRYSVDELPQLVNVLRGEMSLVGPRPHPLDDVERYDDIATRRLRAKPGMTGLWQVSGRSDVSWEQSVRLDLYYVENWSLATDVLILMRTVRVVVAGRGAY